MMQDHAQQLSNVAVVVGTVDIEPAVPVPILLSRRVTLRPRKPGL